MCILFFLNDTTTTEISTLSLHDALPICHPAYCSRAPQCGCVPRGASREYSRVPMRCESPRCAHAETREDRKSTRLNSSHMSISYAVFCLKKKIIKLRRNRLEKVERSQRH